MELVLTLLSASDSVAYVASDGRPGETLAECAGDSLRKNVNVLVQRLLAATLRAEIRQLTDALATTA